MFVQLSKTASVKSSLIRLCSKSKKTEYNSKRMEDDLYRYANSTTSEKEARWQTDSSTPQNSELQPAFCCR